MPSSENLSLCGSATLLACTHEQFPHWRAAHSELFELSVHKQQSICIRAKSSPVRTSIANPQCHGSCLHLAQLCRCVKHVPECCIQSSIVKQETGTLDVSGNMADTFHTHHLTLLAEADCLHQSCLDAAQRMLHFCRKNTMMWRTAYTGGLDITTL